MPSCGGTVFENAAAPAARQVFGSALDPFPGSIRTYDVTQTVDLRKEYELTLLMPLFQWSRMPVWFSAHSPTVQAEVSWAVREVEFDRFARPRNPHATCPALRACARSRRRAGRRRRQNLTQRFWWRGPQVHLALRGPTTAERSLSWPGGRGRPGVLWPR